VTRRPPLAASLPHTAPVTPRPGEDAALDETRCEHTPVEELLGFAEWLGDAGHDAAAAAAALEAPTPEERAKTPRRRMGLR